MGGYQIMKGMVMMKKRQINLLYVSLSLCLILSGCKGKNSADGQGFSPVKGSQAVDITFRDLEGRTVSLSQFNGKVVMLNFWATWCPPCREEMPSMNEFYKNFKDKGLIMLAVSVDGDAQTIDNFIKKNNYTLPVYHDPGKAAAMAYGITGVPETFVIDKKGQVAEKVIGPFDWMEPQVASFVRDLLQ